MLILIYETVFSHTHTLQRLFIAFPVSWAVTTILMWAALIIQKVLSCRE